MNKRINDKDIDTLLTNYCTRKKQIAFDVETENKKYSISNFKRSAFAIPAIAIILIFSFALLTIIGAQKSPATPKGFFISASAAEREPIVLENVEMELCPKDEKGLYADIVVDNGNVAIEPIWFNMNGENVKTFDYKCEKGELQYVIPNLKDEKLNGDSSITQDDYFRKGKNLNDIPYDNKNPEHIFVSWYNLSVDKEVEDYFGNNFFDEAYTDEIQAYKKELLKTNDDFNRYFSDTITITAHYVDGTSETAEIEITIDTRKEGHKIYGNYICKYK